MKRPDITVITAVYNRKDYIKRAVNSLLQQSFENWELILVDDGSSDDTLKVLIEYQSIYKNIKVFSFVHKNLPASRNAGIELSSGKYLTFLDSDDEYLPMHLETRYEYMICNPEIDLLHGGVVIIGDEFVADKNNLNKSVSLSECVIGATLFGKRNVFEHLGGFDEIDYGEDSEFLERAVRVFKVEKVNFPTYVYHRDTPDSITNRIRSDGISGN